MFNATQITDQFVAVTTLIFTVRADNSNTDNKQQPLA